MNYKKLTIHEKINFKDFFKGYYITKSKSGYTIWKEDPNYHSMKNATNKDILAFIKDVNNFIQNYGIFQPYMNK